VVGQLAISLGLVTGSALLGRSVLNANRADPGLDPDRVLVGFIDLAASGRYQAEEVAAYQERLVAELERVPGVESAALAGQAPILGGHSRSTVSAADRANDPRATFEAEYTVVTPGYFETLGIPLLQGRLLGPAAEEPEPVVVVNEALARMFWPGEDAVGRELARGDDRLRVVGVVADVQMRSLRSRANPGVYYPYHQEEERYVWVHLKTRGPPASAVPGLRAAVSAVDPEVPVTGITDLRNGLARSLSETRTFGMVVSVFAGLALALSVVGLYGLISYGVAQRTREMGIRLALGAPGRRLVHLVMARALALSVLGMALGLGMAVAMGQALKGVLYGIGPGNPLTLLGSAVILLASSLLAAWIPAYRASRVDAVVSLRE
jgi:predicted permease